jgi:hypothetical protein
MPSNDWYDATSNKDNVVDDGAKLGWAGGNSDYGPQFRGGRKMYSFGAKKNSFGTWGQFIFWGDKTGVHQDHGNPSGLNGKMPSGAPPDNSKWVQGHLINGEIGGSGAMADNLVPIGQNLNRAHATYESLIQDLLNLQGDVSYFNPNKIANTWLIYRVHALPPPAGTHLNVPAGIVISLGFVINGRMTKRSEVRRELDGTNDGARATGSMTVPRWFNATLYHSSYQARATLIENMVGGHSITY